ncbi:MAG TPA: adenosylmethionine--8-amino-7-oxononanoate transaminase [Sedimentisphaerales bacterium]|nr:adenosylmethionine--8-amino-7-oxononanoate transaminase [Sedimentisphaerales bacterium]
MNEPTKKLIGLDKKYLWHPFTQMADWLKSEPVIIDSAEGFHLIDTEGKRYIDGVSSLWCNVHGHRVKKIDDAIKAQMDKVSHSTLLGLGQTRSIELSERLIEVAPPGLKKVFYSDSGATAVEIALKMAYQYFQNRGDKKRTKFIALKSSYHGDTIGSVSLGGIDTFHSIFKPLLFETFFAPAPHPYCFDGSVKQCALYSLDRIEDILENRSEQLVAVIVEPLVQGAGGIIVHPEGFLKGVRELTQKYGVLLIADEVATGFGKTGKMFGCENEQVSPDIMCLGKGLSGGYLPLAATLTTEEIFDAFLGDIAEHKTFYHGHTYTGNALACAAALASLELFEENKVIESLPAKIALMKHYFAKIAGLLFVGDARQCGLMGGIEIVEDKSSKQALAPQRKVGARLCLSMRAAGVMLRPLGDCVVVMPPVAIDLGLLEKLLEIIYRSIKDQLPGIIGSCDAD